jgi:hypothetical protein
MDSVTQDPRPLQRTRNLVHAFWYSVENGWGRVVVSQVRRKDKNAPNLGHPVLWLD